MEEESGVPVARTGKTALISFLKTWLRSAEFVVCSSPVSLTSGTYVLAGTRMIAKSTGVALCCDWMTPATVFRGLTAAIRYAASFASSPAL